ncbi:copper transporter complex subunit Ctr4 [Malassezia cuniculi]|uniref:Copper transport protein n=1 Tax=Malassezia cuniculi TaxID=948313 RepID=A0AAF0ERX4_9BASI|nr:copper transporter complex subunit Ctr4 [Malassezia cuniculi]
MSLLFARHGGHDDSSMSMAMGSSSMGSSSMSMGDAASTGSSNSSSSSMDSSSMSSMHSDMKCSASMAMIGNWNTIGTCFLASSWYNSDIAKFAGSCIGIAFWVILTECIRRWSREYDRYIIRTATQQAREAYAASQTQDPESRGFSALLSRGYFGDSGVLRLRPTLIQQALRALLYAIQFTSAYLIMLIAMTYNGYVLLSIILGAMVGYFFSTWDTLGTITLDSSPCVAAAAAPATVRDTNATDPELWTDGNLSSHQQQTPAPAIPIVPETARYMAESEKTCGRCAGGCPGDM